MFRDFSKEAKELLLAYVEDVTDNALWDKLADGFEDFSPTDQAWINKLGLQGNIRDVEEYREEIMRKKRTSKEQIQQIFAEAQEIDQKYGARFEETNEACKAVIRFIEDLTETIDPDGGNLDMTARKGILSADVEALHKAGATRGKSRKRA